MSGKSSQHPIDLTRIAWDVNWADPAIAGGFQELQDYLATQSSDSTSSPISSSSPTASYNTSPTSQAPESDTTWSPCSDRPQSASIETGERGSDKDTSSKAEAETSVDIAWKELMESISTARGGKSPLNLRPGGFTGDPKNASQVLQYAHRVQGQPYPYKQESSSLSEDRADEILAKLLQQAEVNGTEEFGKVRLEEEQR